MSPQRLFLLALLLYIAWRLLRSLIRDNITKEAENRLRKESEDPVCRTLIPKQQAVRLRQDGKTYYFCSDSCCDQFTGEPGGNE